MKQLASLLDSVQPPTQIPALRAKIKTFSMLSKGVALLEGRAPRDDHLKNYV